MSNPEVICFGEVLWDVFPTTEVLGGAPLNVALRLQSFGVETCVVSCVGKDRKGVLAMERIAEGGVTTNWIQQTEQLATGEVLIHLSENGDASYEIPLPVAWDAITISEELINLVKQTPFFIFGSLAARSPFNRNTLQKLIGVARTKIFDVNLRTPHYNIDMVYEMMLLAEVVKMNEEELLEIAEILGGPTSGIQAQMKWLSTISKTPTLCVTRGEDGAVLFSENTFYEHSGYRVSVLDTVGAGDSFLAALVCQLLVLRKTPKEALAVACAIGAVVASKEGANCLVTKEETSNLLSINSN
ncbi:MAG: carbohydrate kinase [Bacteroidetes bacterium]|nr:carbohydrate kinase [Bacteroidota bacterium]